MATVPTEQLTEYRRTRRGLPPAQALPLGLLAVILALAIFGPGSFEYKLDVLGFGVCHQMVSHSFVIGGHPLPVCARCSGIYLGAFTGLGLLLLLRPRAQGLPSPIMLSVLTLLFLTMAADGVNSTFQGLPGGAGLWETTNTLRVITGTLAGMAISFFLYPMFNSAFWRPDLLSDESVIDRPFELFGYGVAAAALVALTLASDGDAGATAVYWVVGLASTAGLLLLLTLANTMIVTLVTRREGRIASWQAALTPLTLALALAILELILLAYLRGQLSLALGLAPGDMPVLPGVR
jgi:uncharacterized membrane protein